MLGTPDDKRDGRLVVRAGGPLNSPGNRLMDWSIRKSRRDKARGREGTHVGDASVSLIDPLFERLYAVPPVDGLPAFLEVSDGSLLRIESASSAQLRAAAKLHITIAERHLEQAERLKRFANERDR